LNVEVTEVPKAADIVRRLTAGLLLLSMLAAFADAGWAAAPSADAQRAILAVMTTDDMQMPRCDDLGAAAETARCLTPQCAPGGIPATATVVPAPRPGADARALVSEAQPRGTSPTLDPPPPR